MQQLGESPVHDLHFTEGSYHHVRGLEVAVDNITRVRVGHGVTDLRKDTQEILTTLGRVPALAQKTRERFALDHLHGKVRTTPLEEADLVDRDDARVLQLPRDLTLREEATAHAVMIAQLLAEHFEGNVASHFRVMTADNGSNPAFSKRLQYSIAPDVLGQVFSLDDALRVALVPPSDQGFGRRSERRVGDERGSEQTVQDLFRKGRVSGWVVLPLHDSSRSPSLG